MCIRDSGAALPPKITVRGVVFSPRRMRLYKVITCNTFNNWRLYSWIRLICTSNRLFTLSFTPVFCSIFAAKRALLACFTAANAFLNAASLANGVIFLICVRSFLKPVPMAFSISAVKPGLAWFNPVSVSYTHLDVYKRQHWLALQKK